jgi:hypothetical protein
LTKTKHGQFFLMFLYVVLYVKDKQAFLYTGNVSVTIESS